MPALHLDYGLRKRRRPWWKLVILIFLIVIMLMLANASWRAIRDRESVLALDNACFELRTNTKTPTYVTVSNPYNMAQPVTARADLDLFRFKEALLLRNQAFGNVAKGSWATLFVGKRTTRKGAQRLVAVEMSDPNNVEACNFAIGSAVRFPRLVAERAVKMDDRTRAYLRFPDLAIYPGEPDEHDTTHFSFVVHRNDYSGRPSLLQPADVTFDGWIGDDETVTLRLRATVPVARTNPEQTFNGLIGGDEMLTLRLRTTVPVARMDPEPSDDPWAFMSGYSISHYLDLAVELQKLDPDARQRELFKLARDPKHASEVYPLCRMLFEAKDKGEFREPSIGCNFFIGPAQALDIDWPLAPITLFKGVPILVAQGHLFGGTLGKPEDYVSYCLAQCRWRDTKFERLERTKIRDLVDEFFKSTYHAFSTEPLVDPANGQWKRDLEWLRGQAE
jgi:hypothetical protein